MRLVVAAVLANLALFGLLVLCAVLASCSDEIHIHPWGPPTDAAPEDAAVIDGPVDAEVDAGVVDAYQAGPPGANLGDPCDDAVPFSCSAPYICAQDSRICTVSCNVAPLSADHAFCGTLVAPTQIGVCSLLVDNEGRCALGCVSQGDCPPNTFCVGTVRPALDAPRLTYCRR